MEKLSIITAVETKLEFCDTELSKMISQCFRLKSNKATEQTIYGYEPFSYCTAQVPLEGQVQIRYWSMMNGKSYTLQLPSTTKFLVTYINGDSYLAKASLATSLS